MVTFDCDERLGSITVENSFLIKHKLSAGGRFCIIDVVLFVKKKDCPECCITIFVTIVITFYF